MSNSIAFDRAAEYYDQTRAVPPEVEAQGVAAIASAFGLEAGVRVLEAGVGTGRWAIPLSKQGYRLHGCDLAMPMMRQLVNKQQASESPVMLTQADITRLPYKAGSFAGVLVVHVFHLVPQYRRAIAEVRRVVQRGGVVLAVGDGVVRKDDFRMAVSHRLGEFMAEYGYQHEDVFDSWDDVLIAMREGASQLDNYTAFTWQSDTTAHAEYESIVEKRWSWLWHLPEAAFQAALPRLREWLEAEYDMDALVGRLRDFNITRVVY
jgi:ubiquinone/menaquinone biosynthesis C-methylase UbiE